MAFFAMSFNCYVDRVARLVILQSEKITRAVRLSLVLGQRDHILAGLRVSLRDK